MSDNEFEVVSLPAVVQGKTMAQWEAEAWLNVERENRGEPHVHPTMSNPPTAEEREAFIQSMTPYETIRAAASDLSTTAVLMDLITRLVEDESEGD